MGILNWSLDAARNALADPLIRALDGIAARDLPGLVRGVMRGVRALADDRGGAIVTGGSDNAYTATTAAGVSDLRAGLTILVRIDRANTAPPSLNVDGTGPRPWCDRDGAQLGAGLLGANRFLAATYDDRAGAWVSDVFSGLTAGLFDAVMRAWWLGLPKQPDGLGPNAPWRNGDAVAFTSETNPAFTLDSPLGRRVTLRLIKEALPTSPDGLDPGEPWLNGDAIAFVPFP